MAQPGASLPALPIAANKNPMGRLPQINANAKRLNGILTNPAVQEITSGKIGKALDKATTHPPP